MSLTNFASSGVETDQTTRWLGKHRGSPSVRCGKLRKSTTPAVAGGYAYWTGGGSTIGRAKVNGTGVNENFVNDAIGSCGVAVATETG